MPIRHEPTRLAFAGLLVLALLGCGAAGERQEADGLPLTWNNVFARGGGVRQVALAPGGDVLALVDDRGLRLTRIGSTPCSRIVADASRTSTVTSRPKSSRGAR